MICRNDDPPQMTSEQENEEWERQEQQGMPVGCEFCTTGTRSLKAFAEYVRDVGIRGQDDTVMRQRACEALGQKWSMEFTPANPGADEAGGEGAASGPRWDADHLAMAERAIGPWHIDAPAAITHLIAHLRERDQRKG